MRTRDYEPTPEEYRRHVITDVTRHNDSITIKYDGRTFGGVILAELPEGIAEHIRPGTEIIVRTHTVETGGPNQVAHMLIPNPFDDGWAEIYEDL